MPSASAPNAHGSRSPMPCSAHVRKEHGRLQPAHVELGRRLRRAVEAADVGAVIRIAAHAPRQPAAYRRRESFPVALRIAAPAERITLAARPRRAAPDDRRAVVRRLEARRRLEHAAVVEQRIDVVQPRAAVAVERDGVVGHLLAEIALDDVDAVLEQRLVRVAPPGERIRIGEVDDAALGQRRRASPNGPDAAAASHAKTYGSPCAVSSRYCCDASSWKSGESTDTYGYSQTQTLRSCALIFASVAARIGIALAIPGEIEARLDVPRGARIERQHVAGNLALAQASRRRRSRRRASRTTRARPTARGSSAARRRAARSTACRDR